MRFAAFVVFGLVVVAACDLQPGGKKAAGNPAADVATAPPAPAPVPADGGVAVAPADAGAQRMVDAMENSDECIATADHIAELVIAGIEDATAKAQQVQDRARLVRRIAETCTRDKWPATAHKCFADAKNAKDLEPCGKALAAPKPE